jgi:hypothetical protein
MPRTQRQQNLGYSELDVETVNQRPSRFRRRFSCECCGRRRCCISPITLAATLSMLCSVSYFCMAGYLIWAIVERSVVLFAMAALFFAETMTFAKYFIEIAMLKHDKAKWHVLRVWIPLSDLFVVSVAVFMASLLLPCGTVADLWHMMGQLESAQFWLVSGSMLTMTIKIITAICLTFIHVSKIITLLPATIRVMDTFNYPWTRQVPAPTAPPLNDLDPL